MSDIVNDDGRRHFMLGVGAAAASTLLTGAPARAATDGAVKPLAGRTAFITGAARGIGRAIAELYAENGADVAMYDIADPALLPGSFDYRVATKTEFDEAVAAVERFGTKVLQVQGDVRDAKALEQAVALTHQTTGRLDIVVANAGYIRWHTIEEGSPEMWSDVLQVNVVGTLNTIKAATPFLRRHGGGRIINMASLAGRSGIPGVGAYCASKWAVIGVTKQAARELGPHNITVNAIAPTTVDTPLYRSEGQRRLMGVKTAAEQDAFVNERSPLGEHGVISPHDVANAALFLAGDSARFISGAVIDVSLGITAASNA